MILEIFNQKLHSSIAPESIAMTRQEVFNSSKPSGSYYLLACLSAIIAAYGLLANSTAVVIGAMLVAPLMGPIFGIALSLTIGDNQRLRVAVMAEIAGIILVVGLSALIGLIPLRMDFGSEIIARTQPTIYDVLIALASGFAGAYTLVSKRISPALPGVAIATALVPPLAACGLNIAAGNWALSGGAFLLFSVNFVAIEFAAAIIFILFGLARLPQVGTSSRLVAFGRHLGISVIVLILAATLMTNTLITMITDSKLDKEIRKVLTDKLNTYAGARLSDVTYNQTDDGLEIRAVVITPQEFDPSRVDDFEKALQTKVDPDANLIISSVISKDSDKSGPVFINADELNHRDQVNKETELMNKVSMVIIEQSKNLKGTQVIDVKKDTNNKTQLITASIRTPKAITPAEVQEIQQHLNDVINSNIKLIVRSILTQDADSTHFIEDTTDTASTLKDTDLDLYNHLLNGTNEYLANIQTIGGVTLLDLSFEHLDNSLNIFVTLNSPITLGPGWVDEFQKYIQTKVDLPTKVTIKSIVGGTATASSYINPAVDN